MAGVNDATKDLRWGVMTVIVLFVAGFTALLFVDEEKGKEDARLASDKEFYDFESKK
jgi:MFS-type transporter involved in bile tolerance (Atg22 family)